MAIDQEEKKKENGSELAGTYGEFSQNQMLPRDLLEMMMGG